MVCNFLFCSWRFTRANETGLCWRTFLLTSDEHNTKENKFFEAYGALIKGAHHIQAHHPHFLNIHISHIMRTSMCSRHLWQESSYCLTVTLVTGYLAHSCFAFARDSFRNQTPGVSATTSGLLNVRSKFPALEISEKWRSEGSEERHHSANQKIQKQNSHFVKNACHILSIIGRNLTNRCRVSGMEGGTPLFHMILK